MDEYRLKEILQKSAFPYLAASNEQWINGDGQVLSFDEMGKKYLKNCYFMLLRIKESIESGSFLDKVDYDKKYHNEIINMTKDLYYSKIAEIKNYLE